MVAGRLISGVISFSAFTLAALLAADGYAGPIEAKPFPDAEGVIQYTLTNSRGASAQIINYGATVTNLFVPDKDGKMGDVVLGFDNFKQYEDQSPYFGAVVGRVGNRIARDFYDRERAILRAGQQWIESPPRRVQGL